MPQLGSGCSEIGRGEGTKVKSMLGHLNKHSSTDVEKVKRSKKVSDEENQMWINNIKEIQQLTNIGSS
jgi:gluconate kinase